MDPYSVLGVSRDASREEITKAYHRKMRIVHPDRGGSNVATQEVTAAYQQALANLRRPAPASSFSGGMGAAQWTPTRGSSLFYLVMEWMSETAAQPEPTPRRSTKEADEQLHQRLADLDRLAIKARIDYDNSMAKPRSRLKAKLKELSKRPNAGQYMQVLRDFDAQDAALYKKYLMTLRAINNEKAQARDDYRRGLVE
jgi:hypothetical protein